MWGKRAAVSAATLVERALELAGALLLGMRAIALVLRGPNADWRSETRTDEGHFRPTA